MDKIKDKDFVRFVEHQFGKIFHRIRDLEEGFVIMAEDFTGLSAAVDRAVSLINEAVDIIKNPSTDNNNQAVIDALALRLSGAADALSGVEPAATPAPAVVSVPVADIATTPSTDTNTDPAVTDTATPPADTPPAA